MKKNFLILLLFLPIVCISQFSKTHYIAPLSDSESIRAEEHFLYISTPSLTPINVKINAIGGKTTNATVSQNSPYIYDIGYGSDTQLMAGTSFLNKVLKNKGFIIEAESLIYVAARVIGGGRNQAGSLVSKGLSALGKEFRVGAFTNTGTTNSNNGRYTFMSVLATENNTIVEISDIKPDVTLVNDKISGNTPGFITLNKGESYIIASQDEKEVNKDGLIGALLTADKPVVFNCGSFGGTNGDINFNLDIGFDQIVPFENIRDKNTNDTKYIFVKGVGLDILERPLIVAHQDNTEVFVDEVSFATLNAGQYLLLDGSQYNNSGNIYVRTTKPAFAYQSVGGSAQPNQEIFFVPPLNCSTPNIVNNIPAIEQIGNTSFTENSGLNIVTQTGATIQIGINGVNYPINALPINVSVRKNPVDKNPNYEVYSIFGLTGNIGVFSDKQVYVSYFGSNRNATYGGYYSGFDIKPEIISDIKVGANSNCIPNVTLKLSPLSSYTNFQWFKDGVLINGETTNSFTPKDPGFYQVKGSIAGCLDNVFSDKIPVSSCPTDTDNDNTCDNIDLDFDNDGILNCTESQGNKNIDISNLNVGNLTFGAYSNSFTGKVTTAAPISPLPFIGNVDGSFVSQILDGKTSSVNYEMTFAKPMNIGMEYVNTANATDLLNSDGDFIINSDIDKTFTVLNPDDQLLIDANYDGIYETGVKEFSSFEIRFRLNSATPLAAGTGTFKFFTNASKTIRFTHKNLSDSNSNKATFKFFTTCVPLDFDADNIPNQLDSDSDNDGIFDTIEAQGNTAITISNTDTNANGLDNAFEPGLVPLDFDKDGVVDYLDLDSDNDGILDAAETASDLDGDKTGNFRDLDSDSDLCFDVIEAGFLDGDNDGIYGNSPLSFNPKGQVNGATYANPKPNYLIAAPISITKQPVLSPVCELENTSVTVSDNGGNTYQWQLSTNGNVWNNLSNSVNYLGVNLQTMQILNVTTAMKGYQYRVVLNKIGNSCGLTSAAATMTILDLPIVKPITIIQCDDDLDGLTSFNLTVKNDQISTNSKTETISFYKTETGAKTADALQLITNPLAFANTTPSNMSVWARVVNANNCFRTAEVKLQVLATKIPTTFKKTLERKDDFLDVNGQNNANNNKRDGITRFDFSSVKTDIENLLPKTGTYSISFYRNEADAKAELNAITDLKNYRNIGYPNFQKIWGRVDNATDNSCFGLGPFVELTVEKLPFANPVLIPRECDDNQDGVFNFNTKTLESQLLGSNQSFPVKMTYFDATNNPLKDENGVLITSPFPATFFSKSQIIKAVVTNVSSLKSSDETTISFVVDDLPEAFPIPVAATAICDDEVDPLLQDGKFAFDTSTFETIILNGQIGMNVYYFDENGNKLPSPLANPFVTKTQNVKVIVENPINKKCTAELIISFKVLPLPKINLNLDGSQDKLICTNLPSFSTQIDAGLVDGSPTTNYNYVWSKDGTVLPTEKKYTLDVDQEGIYEVEVFNTDGCSRIRTIKVTASDIAYIDNIKIDDLKDKNTVTVNLLAGAGDYEFSLDAPTGPFQNSNFFDNVSGGIHEVYVNDKNGCKPIANVTISVLSIPKFFTPNNDNYNDLWSIKGVNAKFYSNSILYIFDRTGKLLKQWVPTNSEGWNGTFNGDPLPADDYWFTLKLDDGREATGHFSLIR